MRFWRMTEIRPRSTGFERRMKIKTPELQSRQISQTEA